VRLAFQTIAYDVDLQLMDRDASPAHALIESPPFWNSTRVENSARFSPDGSRLAVSSFRSGDHEIWVGSRTGSEFQQVTRLGASGVLVGGWSPDGSQIAFEAAVDGNTDVYIVGKDGGSVRRLTVEPSIDGVPSWSGDGRWIYFASTRAGLIADIWRVAADGGQATRITHNGGFEPRESPDGRYLFYLDRPPAGLAADATTRVMRQSLEGGAGNRCSSECGRSCGRSRTRGLCSSRARTASTRLISIGSAIGAWRALAGSGSGCRRTTRT
jgi:Tol biopolymer transport system component